ncbi:MAG: ABC transporter permease [Polyangiaceae bacterium]
MTTAKARWTHRTANRTWVGALDDERSATGEAFERRRVLQWFHVLVVLTRHDFRSRYRAQALGMVWSLLQPLVTMALLAIIFSRVFQSSTRNLPIFLLVGIVTWQWIATSLTTSTVAFVSYGNFLKNTVFPRELLPISMVLSTSLNFALESLLLPLFIPAFPDAFRVTPALLLVPVFVFLLGLMLAGAALVVSVLNVLFRDVAYIVTTGVSILYWLTPVIYPVTVVPEPFQLILKCNPLGAILTGIRDATMNGTTPSALGWASMLLPTILLLVTGTVVFRRMESVMLDNV